MVEELGEFDEGHFGIRACHVHDPAAEGLAEGVRADVLRPQLIHGLDPFQMAIHHLAGQDRSVFAEEARLRGGRAPKGPPAVPDMLLEALVHLNLPALPGLLLIQGKSSFLGQHLFPTKLPQVREPQPKEASAPYEQGHPVVPVPV